MTEQPPLSFRIVAKVWVHCFKREHCTEAEFATASMKFWLTIVLSYAPDLEKKAAVQLQAGQKIQQ